MIGGRCQDGSKFNRESKIAARSYNAVSDVKTNCLCSTHGSGAKRVWEASLSSLKSKKVKGGHSVGCNIVSESAGDSSCYHTCPSAAPESSLLGLPHSDPSTRMGIIAESCARGEIVSEASFKKELMSHKQCFKIMLMNIADDVKKEKLTKVRLAY